MSHRGKTGAGFVGSATTAAAVLAVAAGVALGPVGITVLEWKREQQALEDLGDRFVI